MFYLFNSALRPTYFGNVYRILGLPKSCNVKIRYSVSKNAPSPETDKQAKNALCTICFIDRYGSGGYVYFPIRRGLIKSVTRDQGRVYYDVELLDHCHATSPIDFTAALQEEAREAPRLAEDDAEKDGVYCVSGPQLEQHVITSASSWATAVDQLYDTKRFSGDVPTFFLTSLEEQSTGSSPRGGSHGLILKANRRYDLHLSYRYPQQRYGNAQKKISALCPGLLSEELPVGSAEDRLDTSFMIAPLDYVSGKMSVRSAIESAEAADGEASCEAAISFCVSTWRLNAKLLGALYLVCLFYAMYEANWAYTSQAPYFSALLEALKFVTVLWMVFQYRGKLRLPGL